VTLSFTLDKTFRFLVKCYGLTKDPTTQDYILVLNYYQSDLRHFLKDNYHSITLLQKYNIIYEIIVSLDKIHKQDIVHRDLHSGNILCDLRNISWYISDLGLSGPVDKPSNSIYGNLPYIAPEVICGEIYTTKSDIYSMGILMWEVITGETPFDNYEHEFELTLDIVKGCRPKIYEYIPHEYVTLMKQRILGGCTCDARKTICITNDQQKKNLFYSLK
jgi:serine/threonine protein kinase